MHPQVTNCQESIYGIFLYPIYSLNTKQKKNTKSDSEKSGSFARKQGDICPSLNKHSFL